MNRLTALIEAAKAATPGPWVSLKNMPCPDYAVESVTLRICSGICPEHDSKFIALANPATILELCALLEKAEEAIQDLQAGASAEGFRSDLADEALAAIKQWKEQT